MEHRAPIRTILPALALVLLTGLSCFWHLGGCGILDLDEGLYAEAAREMALTGDAVVPRLNGAPFYEKPPLAYWAAAISIRLFGRTEAAARLPSALATALTAWLLVWWGGRRLGRRAGLLAGAFYLSSPLVIGPARLLTTDAALCLWIAVAMVAAYEALERAPGVRTWAVVFGSACGLGVLAKGLPGIVFPAGTAALWCWFVEGRRTRAALARLGPLLRLGPALAFLLVAAPWHVLAYRASGEVFWGEYIVRQHLGRFRGGDTSHLAPFWFYVPVFFAGFFPWSLCAPAAFLRALRAKLPDGQGRLMTFLGLWALLVFLAFSASGSKLVSYILPMAAPTALVVGWWWARALDEPGAVRGTAAAAALTAAAVAGALFAVLALHGPIIAAIERHTHKPVALDAGALSLIALGEALFGVASAAMVASFGLALARFLRGALAVQIAGMAAFVAVAVGVGVPGLARTFTAPLHSMVALAAREADGGSLLLNVGAPRRPSMLYYLPDPWLTAAARARRRLTEDGSVEGAQAYFASHPNGVAVMPLERAERFVAGGDVRIVARSAQWAVVRGLEQNHR